MNTFEGTIADVVLYDTLPDLDNAYVFEVVDEAADELGWNGMGGAIASNLRLIGFHDALGNENYLMMDNEHPIKIQRN